MKTGTLGLTSFEVNPVRWALKFRVSFKFRSVPEVIRSYLTIH